MQDSDLLRDYLQSGSEAAFAELVKRYVNLVHSTAWRQVRNPDLAAEVAQTVFCLLARKAGSLKGMHSLAGWLYRATCFSAAKTLRGERRRQRREQEALQMQSQNSAIDARWEKLAPLLDEALASLSEKERLAVLLRFFQHKPMREVGQALGVSEAAAKMRVGRSVERLRELLVRRGVACSGAGLAALLADHAAQAAPAMLVPRLTATAVAATAGSGASALSGWQVLRLMVRLNSKVVLLAGAGAALLVMVGWHALASRSAAITLAAGPKSAETGAGITNSLKRIGGAMASGPEDRELAEAITALRAALRSTNDTYVPGLAVVERVQALRPHARVAFEVLKEAAAAHDSRRLSTDEAELAPRRAVSGMGFLGWAVPEAHDWLWALYGAEPSTRADSMAFIALESLAQQGLEAEDIARLAQLVLARPTPAPPAVPLSEMPDLSADETDPRDGFVKRQVAEWIDAEIWREPIGTQPFVASVRALLADGDSGVRFWAACALVRSEGARDPAVLEELRAGLKTADADRLAWASQMLENLGEAARPVAPALLEAANSTTNQPAREWAFRAAGRLAGELRNQVPEVNQALTKMEEYQRWLDKINYGTNTSSDLVAGLKEPGSTEAAAQLLGEMGPPATNALPALVDAFSRPDQEGRDKILLAMHQIDPQAALAPSEAVSILSNVLMNVEDKSGYNAELMRKLCEEDHFLDLAWCTREGFPGFARHLATNNVEAYHLLVQAVLEKAPQWQGLLQAKPSR